MFQINGFIAYVPTPGLPRVERFTVSIQSINVTDVSVLLPLFQTFKTFKRKDRDVTAIHGSIHQVESTPYAVFHLDNTGALTYRGGDLATIVTIYCNLEESPMVVYKTDEVEKLFKVDLGDSYLHVEDVSK